MHIAERMELPAPYVARPYRGPSDHPAMAQILTAYRLAAGDPERASAAQMDSAYAHLEDCDPALDVFVVEAHDEPVGYGRTSFEDRVDGARDCVVFAPILPEHLHRDLFDPVVGAQEQHLRPRVDEADSARYMAFCGHPGPGREPTGEAAWLESRGYRVTEWEASLVRPHLDDIPERSLPDGVELRPVTEEQVRSIIEAHVEAFRGEWDFTEPTEADILVQIDDPLRDVSLWKVAWAGDQVVGQVKPYIDPEENAERGYLRGYTEYISVHRDWRNRGIAGTLLARSLQELRERGMTEAALGVDTNNPGGAFQLYTGLGFELRSFGAVYTKPA